MTGNALIMCIPSFLQPTIPCGKQLLVHPVTKCYLNKQLLLIIQQQNANRIRLFARLVCKMYSGPHFHGVRHYSCFLSDRYVRVFHPSSTASRLSEVLTPKRYFEVSPMHIWLMANSFDSSTLMRTNPMRRWWWSRKPMSLRTLRCWREFWQINDKCLNGNTWLYF